MSNETIEQIYEEHLKKEPKKFARFFPEIKQGIETLEHTRWRIEKDTLELVKTIPKEGFAQEVKVAQKVYSCNILQHFSKFFLRILFSGSFRLDR